MKPSYKAMLLILVIAIISVPSACFWFSKVYSIDIPNFEMENDSDYDDSKISKNNLILREIINQLPTIILNNGVAEVEKKEDQELIIKHPVTGVPVIAMNINNNVDPVTLRKTAVVINKREIIFQFFQTKSPIIYKFTDIVHSKKQDHIVIDRLMVQKLILNAKKNLLLTIPLVLYPISCVIGFMVIMFRSLVFSAAAIMLPSFAKGLNFTSIFQLAMLGAIPTAIIEIIASLLLSEIGVSAGLIHFINISIATGYFIFAVKSYHSSTDRMG